jgi:hypothetical protein
MPAQRQDYILGQIQLLRQFVARLLRRREEAGLNEAIQLAMHLQEKLFGMPAADFLRLEVSEQIAALQKGESKEEGHAKCLAYATLLKETAALYAIKEQPDLAAGARQLALHVVLSVAVNQPANDTSTNVLLAELTGLLEHTELHPPVRELQEKLDQRGNS